jgi:hypothetical protein
MKAFWEIFLTAYGVAWLLLLFACFAWEAWKLFKGDE